MKPQQMFASVSLAQSEPVAPKPALYSEHRPAVTCWSSGQVALLPGPEDRRTGGLTEV